MKCVRHIATGAVARVEDSKAISLINTGKYEYVPKYMWRSQREYREAMEGQE